MGVWNIGDYGLTFRLIRQADGLYALQTENGINYVTAVNGGGQGAGARALETNRKWVLGWRNSDLKLHPTVPTRFRPRVATGWV